MATFKQFEDIMAWQKGREVTNRVYEATNKSGFANELGAYEIKSVVRAFR